MNNSVTAKWVIEDLFDSERLSEFFKGVDGKFIEACAYSDIRELYRFYPRQECVVFVGSLQLAKRIKKEVEWSPGVFYNQPAFECINYYPAFGDHMLNADYETLIYEELPAKKEHLYDRFSQDRTIFLRPNSEAKSFTGTMIFKEKFDEDITRLGYGDLPPSELIMASSPVNLQTEWRFVVVNREVITGSQYRQNNCVGICEGYPQEAFDFANTVAKLYNPDPAWVLDICLTKGGNFKIVEIGCFSCAGLYHCDFKKIIDAVSKIAVETWNEKYQKLLT